MTIIRQYTYQHSHLPTRTKSFNYLHLNARIQTRILNNTTKIRIYKDKTHIFSHFYIKNHQKHLYN